LIKARLVSLHRNRNKKANRPFFFSSAANHHCERRFACFGARLDGTTSRLLTSSASVGTGIKKENHQVHDIRFTELWHELLYIFLLLKKISCIVDALDELYSDHAGEFSQPTTQKMMVYPGQLDGWGL
jgi:hypothetical protein